MRSVGTLVEACFDAYKMAISPNGIFRPIYYSGSSVNNPGYWITHCNEAFNFIARRMEWDEFDLPDTMHPTDAKLANMIHDAMEKPDGHWRRIDAVMAQELANMGCLVAAVSKKSNDHGHICVIMPGKLEHSGSFNELVPKVLDIGKNVQLCVKASFAFRNEFKPKYFCLKNDFSPSVI